MSNIHMVGKNEEADAEIEVPWTDQQRIRAVSKLNAQIDDLEEHLAKLKQEREYLGDLAMELELTDEYEPVLHKVGNAFQHIPVPEALERVENDSNKLGLDLENIQCRINSTQDKISELKKYLYTKLGNAINLEKD